MALIIAKEDKLIPAKSQKAALNIIKPENVMHLEEMSGGHITFMIGSNQTYFTENTLPLIKKYNPVY